MPSEHDALLRTCLGELRRRHGLAGAAPEDDVRLLAEVVGLAVAAEREACAAVADEWMRACGSHAAEQVGRGIRARQDVPPPAPAEVVPELPPGRYRHFKGGHYEVLGVARHSETGEELVVYRALYGAGGLWVRPRGMFLDKVRIQDEETPRFHYLGPG